MTRPLWVWLTVSFWDMERLKRFRCMYAGAFVAKDTWSTNRLASQKLHETDGDIAWFMTRVTYSHGPTSMSCHKKLENDGTNENDFRSWKGTPMASANQPSKYNCNISWKSWSTNQLYLFKKRKKKNSWSPPKV